MNDCIFCKIVKGEIPAEKVGENKLALAFLDINPASEGHTVVIPKNHVDGIYDLQDKDYQAVMKLGKDLAQKIQKELQPIRVGYMVYGFDVPHAHLHVIPLQEGNEISVRQEGEAQSNDLKETAKRVKLGNSTG